MSINSELLEYQKVWFSEVFEPCIKENSNICFSYPFFTGVSEKYDYSQSRIMIVGQETRGWNIYKPDWSIEDSQKWSIEFLERQLKYKETQEIKDKYEVNRSPFWNFFRAFNKLSIVPCWNNIDKSQKSHNKNPQLPMEIRIGLNTALLGDQKTLFQKEVEITKPDALVFVTGPDYIETMAEAMQVEVDVLRNLQPSINNGCTNISSACACKFDTDVSVFWTYHPRYIQNKNNPLSRKEIIDNIASEILKIH